MSEVNTVFTKSSKQILSLAKTLKDNKSLEDRVRESLLIKPNVETIRKKLKHKFTKHPEPLSSESEISLQTVKNGHSESSLSFNYSKSCDISVTHSERSVLASNFFKHSKFPQMSPSPSQSCLESQITVRSRKMEITDKETVESVCLKNLHQHALQSTNKFKPHAVNSAIRPVTSNQCTKVDVPNKPREATGANCAFQKKNIDQKLRSYLQRISCCIEEIRAKMVKGIEPPDGIDDWERIKVRTSEFSARFSRNYLYPLGREMIALQEISTKSGSISNRTARNIHQRMSSAHHLVLQAFQAYHSNMTTLQTNALAAKLQYVIEQTYILCDIHTKYINLDQTGSSKRETLINVLTNRCNVLSDKIQDIIEKRGRMSSNIFSPATRLSLMGYNVNVKKPAKPKPRKKLGLEARLSMYSIAPVIRNKDAFWKKTVEALAKDKLRYNHVHSRYKTAGFKHRPLPTEKPTVTELPTKSKLFGKRSSCLLRNTPISSPHNEDNILTMVEMQKDKECNSSNLTKNVPHEQQWNNVNNKNVKYVPRVPDCEQQSNNVKDMQLQAFTPFIQGICQQVCAQDGEAMTQKQLEILLKGLLGMALDGKINNNNDDKETGSKKNGFVIHSNSVNEVAHKILQSTQQLSSKLDPNANLPILSKNDKLQGHVEEIAEKDTENLKKIESKGRVVENRKSLDEVVKNLNSSTVASKTIEERSNNIEETFKTNKVEFDEVNISEIKKSNNGQMNKNKNKRRQTVTVTGAKNAQLICICDEDSIMESPDTSLNLVNNKNYAPIKDSCSSKQKPAEHEFQKNPRTNTSKLGMNNPISKSKVKEVHAARSPIVNIKISRLPKKLLKKLTLVPKTQAFNAIQYKLQYNKFTKGNHMYRKSSKVQPWAIVDTISDHLLNDLLLSVAREIQVDQILQSLYHSEFQ